MSSSYNYFWKKMDASERETTGSEKEIVDSKREIGSDWEIDGSNREINLTDCLKKNQDEDEVAQHHTRKPVIEDEISIVNSSKSKEEIFEEKLKEIQRVQTGNPFKKKTKEDVPSYNKPVERRTLNPRWYLNREGMEPSSPDVEYFRGVYPKPTKEERWALGDRMQKKGRLCNLYSLYEAEVEEDEWKDEDAEIYIRNFDVLDANKQVWAIEY
jgi:hypothetical protein